MNVNHILNVNTWKEENNDNQLWILDSGTTKHVSKTQQGLSKLKPKTDNERIKDANGNELIAKTIGEYNGNCLDDENNLKQLTLGDVEYSPNCTHNLLSMNRLRRKGFKISEENGDVIMKSDTMKLIFNIELYSTDERCLVATRLIPNPIDDHTHENVTLMIRNFEIKKIKMDINMFHRLIGHPYQERLKQTEKYYDYELTGKLEHFIDCSLAKARRRIIPNSSPNQELKPAERICIDITYPLEKSLCGTRYLLLVVCQFTKYKFGGFLKEKSKTTEFMIKLIKNIERITDWKVKKLRCDNSGENLPLNQDYFLSFFPSIEIEYIAPYSPKQNGLVERILAIVSDGIRSLLNGEKFPLKIRVFLWAQAAQHLILQ